MTEKEEATVSPNITAVAPVKHHPEIVTVVPPVVEPDEGDILPIVVAVIVPV